jgi:hypothetical protein
MTRGGRVWARVGLMAVAVVIAGAEARAQNWPGLETNLTAGGTLPLPPLPPPGAYGEVIFANTEWLVVQNQNGQQFPIKFADVINGNYLVRWATTPEALTQSSMVEAMGPTFSLNTLNTGHIDVYEGADQMLVRPQLQDTLSFGRAVTAIDPTYQRMMNAFDISSQNQLYAWVYPINTAPGGIPGQMYAVGSFLGFNGQGGLNLAVPGNRIAIVMPDASNHITMTQVTKGLPVFAQKGDIVFLVTNSVAPRGLVLSQLVLYKKIARKDFKPTNN